MIIRNACIAGLITFGLLASACTATDTVSSAADALSNDALVGSLTGGTGLSAEQAGGGLGSIMSLAQNKLPGADYDALAKVLPNGSTYLKMAKDAGVLTTPINDVGRLNSAMSKLGISPSQASDLYSSVTDFVSKSGGQSLGNSLGALLQ
jgi:hypothetical protein